MQTVTPHKRLREDPKSFPGSSHTLSRGGGTGGFSSRFFSSASFLAFLSALNKRSTRVHSALQSFSSQNHKSLPSGVFQPFTPRRRFRATQVEKYPTQLAHGMSSSVLKLYLVTNGRGMFLIGVRFPSWKVGYFSQVLFFWARHLIVPFSLHPSLPCVLTEI
jgi:Flp pilus assembly protein TadB